MAENFWDECDETVFRASKSVQGVIGAQESARRAQESSRRLNNSVDRLVKEVADYALSWQRLSEVMAEQAAIIRGRKRTEESEQVDRVFHEFRPTPETPIQ